MQVGELTAPFTIRSPRGDIDTNHYRGRRDLVVLLLEGRGKDNWRPLLDELTRRYDQIKEAGAEVLAVLDSEQAASGVQAPFPVGWDPNGALLQRLTGLAGDEAVSAVFVTDRFGEVFMQDTYDAGAPPPQVDEIIALVDYIERQCPECGAPAGGWERL